MPYPGGATFDFPGQGVGGGRKWEDLGALRIKGVRVTREQAKHLMSRARKHSPVYHSMSRGGCQGKCQGNGAGARASKSRYARRERGETRERREGAKKVSYDYPLWGAEVSIKN